MPRIHVNVRPSTIQFDDGENPIVSGAARFGTALAQLPVQMQHLRMQEAAAKEDQRRFDLTNALQMHADTRAGETHALQMTRGHHDAVEDGSIIPSVQDPGNVTPEEENDLQTQAYGREDRQARLDAMKARGDTHNWTMEQPKDGDPVLLDRTDGTTQPWPQNAPAPRARPAAAAAPPDTEQVPFGQKIRAGLTLMRSAGPGDEAYQQPRQAGAGSPGSSHNPGQPGAQAAHGLTTPTGPTVVGPAEAELGQGLENLLGEHAQDAFKTILTGHPDDVRELLAHDPEGHLRPLITRYIHATANSKGAAAASANPRLEDHSAQPAPRGPGLQPTTPGMGMRLPSMGDGALGTMDPRLR